jgi:hypothetical protein
MQRHAPKSRLPIRVLIVCLLLSANVPAAAESTLRCGRYLVSLGDNKAKVLNRCGAPDLKEIVSGADQAKVEQWVYSGDSHRFARELTFRGTTLTHIRSFNDR